MEVEGEGMRVGGGNRVRVGGDVGCREQRKWRVEREVRLGGLRKG